MDSNKSHLFNTSSDVTHCPILMHQKLRKLLKILEKRKRERSSISLYLVQNN